MPTTNQPVIGFDLGGTKMVACLYDDDFRKIGRSKTKTRAQESDDAIFERLEKTIREALAKANVEVKDLAGIGIGSPGPLDVASGTILDTPNINLRQFPLKARLNDAFDCPVVVGNDVSVGTYGEHRFGAGKGCQHVLGVFPGTGLGGGMVLNGKLYQGATGNAGEIGHMIVQTGGPRCNCGQYGCLEAVASRTAMSRDAVVLANAGYAPTVVEQAGTDISKITSKVYLKAWKEGEPRMVELIERAAWFLGVGIANLVNILSPELIVVGGGLMEKMGKPYLKLVDQAMRQHAMPALVKDTRLVEAKLGDDAIVLGAAALVRDALEGGEN